jgi:hypothetical protein
MRPICSSLHSLSFNVVPHKLKFLDGYVTDAIETILDEELGLS